MCLTITPSLCSQATHGRARRKVFDTRTGLENSFVTRFKETPDKIRKTRKNRGRIHLDTLKNFFKRFDEVAARISSTGAEDIFETGSS
jgi:hypothetical protein